MAHNEIYPSGVSHTCLGLEWNAASYTTYVTIAPTVWRWDEVNTANTGGRFSESLSPDPSGAGYWSGLSWGTGSGWRQVDSFSTRTYYRTKSTQTVTLTVTTDASYGTYWYGWVNYGKKSVNWKLTIDPLPSYTVSFNANGGSGAPGNQTKWYGENLTLSSTKPTRTGYTFKGWATTQARANAGTVDKAAGASYTANAAQTYYAVWQINTWVMTYKANGGTGADQTQTKTYNVTAATKAANTFTRTNFAFKRWNTKSDDTGTAYNASASYTGNAALTLYAIWNRTVTFNANDGSGAPSAQTAVATSAITLSSTKPTRTSYVFKRWNTNTSDSGTAYSPGASYAKNLGSTTLYAIWNPVVSYDANGGTGAPAPQTKTYGENLVLTTEQPTRDGFSFRQWNTASDGSGTAYATNGLFASETATTLYATWNATVAYNANGGTGAPASQRSAYGSTITLSFVVPTRSGHTFLEWNTKDDGSGTSYQPGDEYSASNGNLTLYAKWRVDIVVTNIECKFTDSLGNIDALGHYVTVSASYDTTSSGNDCTYFGATLTVDGASEEHHSASPGATGTDSFTFGPFAYDDLTPLGGTSVGVLTASNSDGSIEFPLTTAKTGYVGPNVTSLVAYREEDGDDSDDGTDLGIEIGWSVFQTRSQSIPTSITLTLTDRATGAVTCTRTWTGITDNPATLHVVPTQDDVTSDGELLATEKNYVVTMTVNDAWKSATNTDEITVAYYTMDFLAGGHGAAFGKPSTQAELLDVGYGAQFEGDIRVKADNIDKDGAVPSSNQTTPKFRVVDNDGMTVGMIEAAQFTNGSTALRLFAHNYNETESDQNTSTMLQVAQGRNAEDGGGNVYTNGYMEAKHLYKLDANADNYGAIRFASSGRNGDAIRFYGTGDNADGDEIVIGNGGQVIIGAGESPVNLHNALAQAVGTEQMYITSDNTIYFVASANTIANRAVSRMYAGNFIMNSALNSSVAINTSSNNGNSSDGNISIGNVSLRDKNDYWTGDFASYARNDGAVVTYIGARNKNTDGTDVSNYINLLVKKDGTQTYSVTSPANFRSAIAAAGYGVSNKWTATQQQAFSGNKNWSEKDTVMDLTTANNGFGSGTRYQEWLSYDKNNYIAGGVTNAIESGGNVQTILRTRNYKTGTTTNVDNSLTLTVAKDGTRSVSVSESAPWRAAISCHTRYTQLYNNTSGSSATITLSATAANYTWMRIYFYGKSNASNAAKRYSSVDVYSPNGKIVQLSCTGQGASGNTQVLFHTKLVTISGTSVKSTSICAANIDSDGTGVAANNEVYITRVEGWNN